MNLKISKKDFIWNMIGATTFSMVSMLLSLVIINLTNATIGGIFSFGYTALSQTIFTISYFGARSYHITDIQYRFSFNSYKIQRFITSIFAVLIGFIYIFILYKTKIYDIEKSIILCLLVICGMLDGFFDVYECELQRIKKLYLAGIGLFLRTIIFALLLILLVFITKNIVLSLIVSLFFKFLSGYVLEVKLLDKLLIGNHNQETLVDYKTIMELTIVLLPMFLSTFMDIFMHSATKYAIDLYIDDYHSGLFNILFMPSNIIYLMATFIMRPIVTNLSILYENNATEYYNKTTKILIIGAIFSVILVLLSLIVFVKMYVLLISMITNNLYINDLNSNETLFMFFLIMLGSAFYALATPLFHFVIIEKRLNAMLVSYAISTLISIIINFYLIGKFGYLYSALAYCLSMFIWFVAIFICFKTHWKMVNKNV